MSIRTETLMWGGMPHSLQVSENSETGRVSILFTIVKKRATQALELDLPHGITLQDVLDGWEAQGRAWVDLFPPHNAEGQFAVVRAIHLKQHRLLWYVLHERDVPQDALVLLAKPSP